MKERTVRIPRECCFDKCRRTATRAYKLSDFWISTCDVHVGGNVSINKALDQLFANKQPEPVRLLKEPDHS